MQNNEGHLEFIVLLSIIVLLCQFLFGSECEPYTEGTCRDAANYNGLMIGGKGKEFAGEYTPKGCYAYASGKNKDHVYYGIGGTLSQMKSLPVKKIKYRPVGYDCNYQGIQTIGI